MNQAMLWLAGELARPGATIRTERAPAFYARTGSLWGDTVALLHPPYTLWHMSYAAVGAALAPSLHWPLFWLTLFAFFMGTGVAAHALDELNGRPLGTGFSNGALKVLGVGGLLLAVAPVYWAWDLVSFWVLPLALAGGFLVAAYCLEWWNGAVHTDLGFGLAWGAFPVLAGFVVQTGTVSPEALLAAAGAAVFSLAQRSLSTPARLVRRKTRVAAARLDLRDGSVVTWDRERLLRAWEGPLKYLSMAAPLLAAALVLRHV
jgi:hypothetical protein